MLMAQFSLMVQDSVNAERTMNKLNQMQPHSLCTSSLVYDPFHTSQLSSRIIRRRSNSLLSWVLLVYASLGSISIILELL
jgi:hypothetical protein